ncbi:glycosyltransferase family 39 protein [Caldilinea sp.]|uniref:glycosyltransferase family 39 protein n=1 Tax=Caldilinea sp. TaxID=2293560 RepID=UPI002BE8870E|nr:glycosyltransferase family 39 protein [Caldilinea sp.]
MTAISTTRHQTHPRHRTWLLAGATGVLFVVMFILLLGINMRRELNHDEHQFIASAALIARAGLTPYGDFAYFHVPLLSYLYALLSTAPDSLLLSSRLVSVVFGWLSLLLVFGIAWRRFAHLSDWSRWRYASLAALWLLATPVFHYTSGRAWNHDLPTFLLLLAFIVFSQMLTHRRRVGWLLVSGALVGLAATTRLSFAAAVAPFLVMAWLTPAQHLRQRLRNFLAFGCGALLASLAVLIPVLRDPYAFSFGNVGYIQLNAQYYVNAGYGEAMSLAGKLLYFGDLLVATPTNLISLTALVIGLWPVRALLWRGDPGSRHKADDRTQAWTPTRVRLALLLLLILFTLPGSFGATPSQPQYFYPIFPLAILGIVEAFAAWPASLRAGGMYAYVLGAVATILTAVPIYGAGQTTLWDYDAWLPVKVHAYGELIDGLVDSGKVLTLAPLYALEGAAEIYPEFATGPFAWRVASLMTENDRTRLHVVGPDELDDLLQAAPPRAILTGVEDDDAKLEQPLLDYARHHAYVPTSLPDNSTLWLSPQAQWEQTIQLGGHTLPSAPVAPGAHFVLTLYLQSLRPMDTNWSALIRVVDANGNELMRDEGWPYGSPTSQWQPGEVWPDGHEFTVPQDAAPGYYRVDVSFYDPDTLEELGAPASIGYLLVDSEAGTSSPTRPLAQFGEAIELVEGSAASNERGDPAVLTVDTQWRTQKRPEQDYTLFVHVLDRAGNLVAQHDSVPLHGFLPTSAWRPSLAVHDSIEVQLPPDLPFDDYEVVIGFYDSVTQTRLPVPQATSSSTDSFSLDKVQLP